MTETADMTVRGRIADELDGRIHGITVTARRGSTHYAVVAHSTSGQGGDRLSLTTVVVDLEDQTVKPTSNSLWVPRSTNALEGLTQTVARATTDVNADDDETPPVETGVGDVEGLLETEVTPDDYEADDGPSPAQGEPPAEVDLLDERLREAGIPTEERYIRLRFGGKDPWSHTRGDVDYLVENYGVYATSDDALVLVDVDRPEDLDAALPETFRVSSPHGPEERCHHYFAVSDLEQYREALGKWNAAPSWGEVRVANQYVVGPGSQLDGCDKGDACDGRCHAEDGGVYEVVDDREIAEVSASWLIDLLEADPAVDLDDAQESGGGAAPVVVDTDTDTDDEAAESGEEDGVECYECGATVPEEDAYVAASDGETTVYACRGGCDA